MDEKYQRVKVLGKGSFGKAYLVKNTEANEHCVVKQMETSMMDKKAKEDAVKEAMLLKKMDHKNIVRFQEVFMTRKGRLCIVMDYADGGDVHMEIKRREGKLLDESQILEWFAQTCFALKHVHDRKVLHRDLKTQNIFLMSSGQIKLGDFGIARVLDATKDYAKTMVGTPYYLSPEIIEDRPYNFKSDVWSLGVVLYEMTTLKHPFDADSLVTLASKILKDTAPPPDAKYTGNLTSLIRTMLNKDANVRPAIKEILAMGFLYESMTTSNEKYSLGMDLSEYAKAPEVPPAPEREASAEDGEAKAEYDEDFEDYSEPEEDEQPKSELSKSVANLKLALASPAKLDPVTEEAAPEEAAAAGGATKMGQKAAALRAYLEGQVTEAEFSKAYALVRSSGEGVQSVSAEEMQKQVGDIIGAEKAPVLFPLFQTLCFLEEMSRGGEGAPA